MIFVSWGRTFALLVGCLILTVANTAAQEKCRITFAPAQLFVDSGNAIWFVDDAQGVKRLRFPCRLKTFEAGDVRPGYFAENARGVWFTEYLGGNRRGKWTAQVGHVDKKLTFQQRSLGRTSEFPAHASGIAAFGSDLWITETRVLAQYNSSTARTARFLYERNPDAVLLGPAVVGSDLWFVDGNAMDLVKFSVATRKFQPLDLRPALNTAAPISHGELLYLTDWNTGRVSTFNTRTHERLPVGRLSGVSSLKIQGRCFIAVQSSLVNVYVDGNRRVASYNANGGLPLPGGLAASKRFIYFATSSEIVREPLPRACAA